MIEIFSDININNWAKEYIKENKDELMGVFNSDAQREAEERAIERYNDGLEEGFRDGILFVLYELGIKKIVQ